MTMHHLRIFLSSPGDVSRERQLARDVIEQLQSERAYRDWLKLQVAAWDKPGAGSAMPAQLEPQEAIDRGLRKPSQCDIVIVIFWARMGTPLSGKYRKPDGSRYRSGTEYEFLEALHAAKDAGKPDVLVYRRKTPPDVNLADPQRKDKEKQWDLVEAFFAEFRNPDGSYHSWCKQYAEPSDFEKILEQDLRDLMTRYLEANPPDEPGLLAVAEEPIWDKPPFPGLRAFTPAEALIFYGRHLETDGLISRLQNPKIGFIAVVSASGSGKSSLVAAGLLPALEKNAIPGSQDWIWFRFTPAEVGDNPFMALANAFRPILEAHGRRSRDLAGALQTDPGALQDMLSMALDGKPGWAEALLFVDQFEELFTLVDGKYRRGFVDLLARAAKTERIRTVVTMRADFYHRSLEWTVLDELLTEGHYPLLTPKTGALYEMITRPAERAGLRFEEGLAQRILDDTGTQPGALPLMAFTLSELWKQRTADGCLTLEAYERFGGVDGAVGKRAEQTFDTIEGQQSVLEAALTRAFRELVEVDERGMATRRRAPLSQVTREPAAATLVSALTKARLLVEDRGENDVPMVEVAHEAIFTKWPRLKTWIEATGEDLRLRRQLRQAAAEWQTRAMVPKYLWSDDRVVDVVGMLDRLGLGLDDLSDLERRFLGPIDRDAMLVELDDPATLQERRATIGVRVSLLGDPRPGVGLRANGLPDIVWCKVPGGKVSLEKQARVFRVKPFYIAKYPVTWIQYRAFLDADDGFKDAHCWQDLLVQVENPWRQFNQRDNHPAENLCWLEAVAFCRWLTAKLGYEVRLPTEWEWQQAATGGDPANEYPWGAAWDSGRTNTYASGLQRSTAVGLYPHGASPVGALDMSGNVWEFCLNEYTNPKKIGVSGDADRVVRGGSWDDVQRYARTTSRYDFNPLSRDNDVGFRLCCISPSS